MFDFVIIVFAYAPALFWKWLLLHAARDHACLIHCDIPGI